MLKKYNIFTIVILIAVIISLQFYMSYQKSPKDIFYDNVNSIVEVKAVYNKQKSFGTAIFIGRNKYLVTNSHIVIHKVNNKFVPYENIKIRFSNKSKYEKVFVKFFDEKKDIAVLDYSKDDDIVAGIDIRNSDEIDFGETVYAIGNSMNYGISISKGIISIPNIEIQYNSELRKMIQADITISSGNSGGALLDKNGKLIGITTFRTKDNNGNIVYGNAYAIPINDILEYVNTMK